MILRILWKITKAILEGLAKIISYMIFKLYLWIPLLFALIFTVCSAAGLFAFQKYMPHFIVLVSGGVILSFLLCLKKLFNPKPKKSKKELKNQESEPQKKKRWSIFHKPQKRTNLEYDQVYDEYVESPKPQNVKPKYVDYKQQKKHPEFDDMPYVSPKDIQQRRQKRNAEWFNTTYEVVPEIKETLNIPDLKSYSSNNYDVAVEEPAKLYRTRKDPSLFIAEYPDRLEYYRKTPNGMVLVSVEENALNYQRN
ncbi:MAG TPA: hypothetical protein VIL26_03915 [Clostridia bacterium]